MADFGANGQLSWESSIDGGRLSRMTVEALLRELRQAVGDISRRPLSAGALVLLLALGIGANALIFTAVDVLLLRQIGRAHV